MMVSTIMRFNTVVFFLLCLYVATVAEEESPAASCKSPLLGPYLDQEKPGDTPVLFAPGIVSTGKEHSAAMFTTNGNEVWFGRLLPVAIYYMQRIDGNWTEPQIAPFCDTSTTSLYPILSFDGNKIFFSSDRPIEPHGKRLPMGDYHIWMVEKTAGKWSEPKHLDDRINFGRRQSCGSVAGNGDLFFGAFIDNSSLDLFCTRLVEGTYSNPRSLTELNSSTPDHSPFVAPDGSYLIFSSFRGGLGRSDLFISFRSSDGTWSKPKNMGARINSVYKDEYPFVSPDGKYLFFNSNRPSTVNQKPIEDGPGNIYWVSTSVIEELRKVDSNED